MQNKKVYIGKSYTLLLKVISYYLRSFMAQALIKLGEYEDRVLTIVKGKFGLKTKNEAINFVIDRFGENLLEPELRPEYLERLQKIRKGKYTSFSSVEELRKATS